MFTVYSNTVTVIIVLYHVIVISLPVVVILVVSCLDLFSEKKY